MINASNSKLNKLYWRSLIVNNVKNVLLYQEIYDDNLTEILSAEFEAVYSFDKNTPQDFNKRNIFLYDDTVTDIDLVIVDLSIHSESTNIDLLLKQFRNSITSSFQLIFIFKNKYYYKNIVKPLQILKNYSGFGYLSAARLFRRNGYILNRVFCSKYAINRTLDPLPELSNFNSPEKGNMVVDSFIHSIKESFKNTKIGMLSWPAYIFDVRISNSKNSNISSEYLSELINCRIDKIIAGNIGNEVLLITDLDTNKEYVIRKYNSDSGKKSCELNFSTLKHLEKDLNNLIPQAFMRDENHNLYIESRLPDNMLVRFNSFSQKILLQEHKWFDYQLTQIEKVKLSPSQLSKFLHQQLTLLYESCPDLRKSLDTIISQLDSRLTNQNFAFTPIHGDYKVSNLLFDKTGVLTGLIDWDYYQEHSLALYDQLTLVLFILINDIGGGDLGDKAFFKHLWILDIPQTYKDFILKSLKNHGVNEKYLKEVLICFWLCNLSWRHSTKLRNNSHFTDRVIKNTLKEFIEYLEE